MLVVIMIYLVFRVWVLFVGLCYFGLVVVKILEVIFLLRGMKVEVRDAF